MKKIILSVFMTFICLYQIDAQAKSPWFTVNEVRKNVWQIEDHKTVNIYLITGKDSSLVIDTGYGTADLVSVIKKLTDKPLIVVNTHAHPDHSAGNYQFQKVYVNSADSLSARNYNSLEVRNRSIQSALTGGTLSKEELFSGVPIYTKIVPVKEGHIFNLGGRVIEVIETPGHTPGSICLLDAENKLLFSGDINNGIVWLFLPGCSPLHDYLKILEKEQQMISKIDVLFPGHKIQLPASFIMDQITCVKGILNGTIPSKEYQSGRGKAMVSSYGLCEVAFDPGNL